MVIWSRGGAWNNFRIGQYFYFYSGQKIGARDENGIPNRGWITNFRASLTTVIGGSALYQGKSWEISMRMSATGRVGKSERKSGPLPHLDVSNSQLGQLNELNVGKVERSKKLKSSGEQLNRLPREIADCYGINRRINISNWTERVFTGG